MSNELKNIFNEGACLTQNEMFDYLAGRLHGKRLRKAELHIADCELCADAVEGLSLLNEEQQHASIVNLESRIKERVKEKSVIFVLFRRAVAIAAVLLLVIGGAFYLNEFISKKQSQVAENISTQKSEEKKSEENIETKKDSGVTETIKFTPPVGGTQDEIVEDLKSPEQNSNGLFDFKNVPKEEYQTVSKDVTMDDVPPLVENKISEPDTYMEGDGEKIVNRNENDATTISINPTVTTSGTVTQQMTSPNNSYSYSAPQQQLSDVEIISSKKNKSVKDKDLHEESKNQEQPNVFTDSVTVDLPSDIFNLAMQYKAAGEKQRAIDKLDELIKLNNNLKPQAMWEKALLLIDLKKTDKAKSILKELSEKNSEYQQAAIDKLKTL